MNFQGLKNVESHKFYIDLAFRKANGKAAAVRGSKKLRGTRLEKSRKMELLKIDVIRGVLSDRLMSLIESFPNIDRLPEFYNELIKCTVDYPALKKSLGALNWAKKKIIEMHKNSSAKIKKCNDLQKINDYRREFYGRVSSFLKQIKDELDYLEQVRRVMKGYPSIKTGLKTVAIAGFPNVGKTTLLFKLTGSKPEIQPYAFTTKGVNVGYLKNKQEKIQLLDIPGTLDRFEKMNNIERIAFLALKLLAEKIIYVFDLTEPYPLKNQAKLYKRIKQLKKPTIVYLSKTDILDKKDIEEFEKIYKTNTAGQIKKLLLQI